MGLVSKVPEETTDYLPEKLFREGFDVSGLSKTHNLEFGNNFFKVKSPTEMERKNPIKYFNEINEPLPKSLIDYSPPVKNKAGKENLTFLTYFPDMIPQNYFNAKLAYLGPLDFISHRLLTQALSERQIQTIILSPSENIMHPSSISDIDQLLRGIQVFITSEELLANLFNKRTMDIIEMINALHTFGIPTVVVLCQEFNQIFSTNNSTHKWNIPFYPIKIVDPVSILDSFCGGFAAGLLATNDPLKACAYGNVSSSFKVEYSGPDRLLEVLPELKNRRLEYVTSKITVI